MRALLIFVCSLFLTACGQKITGTYADGDNNVNLVFISNNNLIHKVRGGNERELEYHADGNQIRIRMPNNEVTMTIREDGSLVGPKGVIFTKQKN